MQIIDEYKKITEDIAVVRSKLSTTKRKIKRLSYRCCPDDAKGIDYSTEKVQISIDIPDIEELMLLAKEMMLLELDLMELYQQRDELEETINDLGDLKKQVIMLQIKGYTQLQIAKELNYSKRHIERLCKDLKDVGKMSVDIEKNL